MFEGVRQFVDRVLSDLEGSPAFRDDDYRLASASLLVHVAGADGLASANEETRLRDLLAERFGLGQGGAARLLRAARRSDHEAVDLDYFTRVLKRALDREGRRRLLTMMWEIAGADGAPHEVEEALVWRVAEMLGAPADDCAAAREAALARMPKRARTGEALS